MTNLEKASRVAIQKCIGLKTKDSILIIGDKSTSNISKSLFEVSKKITNNSSLLNLDTLRPIHSFPKEIKINNFNVIIFCAQSLHGELVKLRRPLRLKALEKQIRFVHMPGITEDLFSVSVGVNYDKIWEFTKKLRKKIEPAKEIIIATKNGTKLAATFSNKIKWVSSDGDFRKFDPEKLNLPGAEIFTCPDNIFGTIVIDGLLGNIFTSKYGNLKKNPITVNIQDSRIIKITCKNKELEKDFTDYIKTDKNSNRVGEFAFGTNLFLKKYHHNFLVDEKFPGFHLAFGNPYPNRTLATWSSSTHLDCLIRNATAFVNRDFMILKDGKYLI